MASANKIFRNLYRDSVSLMQISARIAKTPGVAQAQAIMASENNLALLREAGLLTGAVEAGPNDVLLVVAADDQATLSAALADAETALNEKPAASSGDARQQEPPRSIEMGVEAMPGANLALISTPSDYA
ncbi:MAG: hypothetical protein ACREFC_07995, partial [Stellaceae bacterium]